MHCGLMRPTVDFESCERPEQIRGFGLFLAADGMKSGGAAARLADLGFVEENGRQSEQCLVDLVADLAR